MSASGCSEGSARAKDDFGRVRKAAVSSGERRRAVLFLLPSFVVFAAVAVYPTIRAFIMSLFKGDLTNPRDQFVGLANYLNIFRDARFYAGLGRSLYFSLASVAISFVLGFAIALLLRNPKIRARNFFRTAFLIPMILSPLVTGMAFRFMYDFDYGVINYFLTLLGLRKIAFVGESMWALMSVILVDAWQWTPFMILVLLAGLESLPEEPYEAARIDGASRRGEFLYVTVPLMKPIILTSLLIRFVDAFKEFDKVYAITGGGPGLSSETLSMYIWKTGFQWFKIGPAAAMSIVMLYFVVFVTSLYIRGVGLARDQFN